MVTRRTFFRNSVLVAASGLASTAPAAEDEIARTIRDTRFIDIHAHASVYECPPVYAPGVRPLCFPDELVGFYDHLDVAQGVVLALCNPENFVGGMSTEEVLRTCAACPGRLIPSVALDPRACGNTPFANLVRILDYYREKGCKVCGEICANLHFLDPRLQNLFAACEKTGISVDFHLSANEGWRYGIVDAPGMPELEVCLARFPKLRFFGHSQSFWCEIGEYDDWNARTGYPKGPVRPGRIPELMRRYPNLYCDLSAGSGNNALARDLDHAGRFVTEFQDRLFFGLDICAPSGFLKAYGPETHGGRWINAQAETLRTLLRTGRITPAVYRKVARENAVRELALA